MAISLGDISVNGLSTGAVTLPGASGKADADLWIQMTGNQSLSVEQSDDNTNWSTGTGGFEGPILVPAGNYVRLRNTNAAAQVAFMTYRYTGTPS